MAQTRIPWLRIGVEGAAIVVSILLAFAIDAWWAELQTRSEEQDVLQGLRSDFVASRGELQSVVSTYELSFDRFARFQRATPAALAEIPPDSVVGLVFALLGGLTFDPVSSALEAVINDGRLRLIRDPELRESLAAWRRALEDIEENAADVRSGRLRVQRSLERHGGPFRIGPVWETTLDVLPEADRQTLASLRRDAAFVGEVRSRYYDNAFYLRELTALQPLLDAILDLIDQNLKSDP